VSLPVAVLASGGGSNLQSILDDSRHHDLFRVALVISDRAEAGALVRAREAGIPAVHVPARDRSAEEVAADTLAALDHAGVAMVALAGYLRLVPAPVIRQYQGRIVNIHPALLPAFGGRGMYGLNVHRAVLAAGCRVSGATVHRVTEVYDEGSIIAQWPVPVLPGDTPEGLAARVLAVEHVLFPAVLRALASGSAAGAPPEPAFFRLAEAHDPSTLAGEILRLAGY
jgi:phosphoribosylglycinamide formyltransferase 1